MSSSNDLQKQETRSLLLNELKNEIKSLIEIASADKSESNDNPNLDEFSITNLCAIIDACLLYGLRTDFFFKTTFDLIKRLAKLVGSDCQPLHIVIKHCQYLASTLSSSKNHNNSNLLWIQVSIMNKYLIDIVDCIIRNSSKFYTSYSLVSNVFDSQLFYSLLAGLDVIKFRHSTQVPISMAFSSPLKMPMSPIGKFSQTYSSPKIESFISPIFNKSQTNYIQNNTNLFLINSTKKKEHIRKLCYNIESKIVGRVFYEWLDYHRKSKMIRKNLTSLVQIEKEAFTPCQQENHHPDLNNNNSSDEMLKSYIKEGHRLDQMLWSQLSECKQFDNKLFYQLVYAYGVENKMRSQVWPYLLGYYDLKENRQDILAKEKISLENYERLLEEWKPFEQYKRIVDENNLNNTLCSLNKIQEHVTTTPIKPKIKEDDSGICSDLSSHTYNSANNSTSNQSESNNSSSNEIIQHSTSDISKLGMQTPLVNELNLKKTNKFSSLFHSLKKSNPSSKSRFELLNMRKDYQTSSSSSLLERFSNAKSILNKIMHHNNPSNSSVWSPVVEQTGAQQISINENNGNMTNDSIVSPVSSSSSRDSAIQDDIAHQEFDGSEEQNLSLSVEMSNSAFSPIFYDLTSSPPQKVLENKKLFDNFALNMHRIDKDVVRCDRNYWYFSCQTNLDKLKNIIYTYVWENIEVGYIQGMCDLIAPLLVILDDESLVYECFKRLMKKMLPNFLHSSAMEKNFSLLNSVLFVLDGELHEYMNSRYNMNQNEFEDHQFMSSSSNSAHDLTEYNSQFYFTYRWFLLDFKRELVYEDIFRVWETIWSASECCTEKFALFIALAMIEKHRHTIMDNHMDFTDIIQYFNELSEKHNIEETLHLSRDLVDRLKQIMTRFND